MASVLGRPIIINLSKDFFLPSDDPSVPHIVGQINPDLRLQHLDAFLEQLESIMTQTKDGASVARSVATGFAKVIASAALSAKAKFPDIDISLEISCELDPKQNNMVYKFNINNHNSAGANNNKKV